MALLSGALNKQILSSTYWKKLKWLMNYAKHGYVLYRSWEWYFIIWHIIIVSWRWYIIILVLSQLLQQDAWNSPGHLLRDLVSHAATMLLLLLHIIPIWVYCQSRCSELFPLRTQEHPLRIQQRIPWGYRIIPGLRDVGAAAAVLLSCYHELLTRIETEHVQYLECAIKLCSSV